MNKEKAAKTSSFILGPQTWFPVLIILSLYKTGLTSQQILILFPSLLIFQILVPLGVVYWLMKQKKVSDWDIRIRKERYKVLPVFMVSTLTAMILIYSFGTILFFHLYLIFWTTALIGVFITYFWKISLHMMLNVTATILVNFLFGWTFPILYIFIPMIGWARHYHKHHTFLQIINGAVVSGLITLGMLNYFGYLL